MFSGKCVRRPVLGKRPLSADDAREEPECLVFFSKGMPDEDLTASSGSRPEA